MTNPWKACFILAPCLAAALGAARADDSAIDWTAWQALPVFHDGRLMPLDTFARNAVEDICGRTRPKLAPPRESTAEPGRPGPFPDGMPRKFLAAELLYEWLVRPADWERIDFIRAEYEPLRDILGVSLRGADGERLKYVSPRDVERSRKLQSLLEEMQARNRRSERDGQAFEMTLLEKRAKQLYDAYVTYRLLSFNPKEPVIRRTRFDQTLGETVMAWRRFEPNMSQLAGMQGKETGAESFAAAQTALDAVLATHEKPDWQLGAMEPHAAALAEATAETAARFTSFYDKFKAQPPDWDAAQLDRVRALFATIVTGADETAFAAETLFTSLYDNGGQMPLVPSLNRGAAKSDTDRGEAVSPWLSIQTVLYGCDAYFRDYPKEPLDRLRETWKEAASAYTSANRDAAATDEALTQFARAVRGFAEASAPTRKNLFAEYDAEALWEKTRYPEADATSAELAYNRADPFFWSWTTCLAAVVFFALAFGLLRVPMFVLGIFASFVAQGWMVWAFAMRSMISGRAPVANMFETVVFVALVASFLGTWMTIVPLFWSGLCAAWNLSAWPWTKSPIVTGREPAAWLGEKARRIGTWVFCPIRIALVVLVGYFLLFYDPGHGTARVINVTLENADFNGLMTWIAGMGVLLAGVWFIPRAALTLVAACWTVPGSLWRIDRAKAAEQVRSRKTVAVVGALLCLLISLFAYYAPESAFSKTINPLMPVLRNNFWLLIHVLTITASYGAGALAWGLSNIAMAYYLFGTYRKPVRPSTESVAGGHSLVAGMKAPTKRFPARAPEACATLAAFSYKAIQVAVLMLAVGTILGGLWAAVSWGRFWGWDPKEVWALISLLVYLVVLHGRYAGWTGNFALHVGAILGATSILMAWYGVNYLLDFGKHSYGRGSGGTWIVLTAVAVNWAYVGAAAIRYAIVRFNPVEPETAGEDSWD